MFQLIVALAPLLVLVSLSQAQQYELTQTYTPANFFEEFDFFTGQDPTGGFVQYVPFETAATTGLVGNASDLIYLGVDYQNVYTADSPGRPSVRLQSKMTYTEGLFVLDLMHMPTGCGTWPAFWTVGHGDWPNDGEIDIIENVNDAQDNSAALHATGTCNVSATADQSGAWKSTDCTIGHDDNQGCAARFTDPYNYGTAFNANGGGIYAMEWTSSVINIWFFPPQSVPPSLSSTANTPNVSEFGLPSASFAGPCSSSFGDKFFNHTIIFDITFCGGWAGGNFGKDGSQCPIADNTTSEASCIAYVGSNPQAFEDTWWGLRSLSVWQTVPGFTTGSPDQTIEPCAAACESLATPEPSLEAESLGALQAAAEPTFDVSPLTGGVVTTNENLNDIPPPPMPLESGNIDATPPDSIQAVEGSTIPAGEVAEDAILQETSEPTAEAPFGAWSTEGQTEDLLPQDSSSSFSFPTPINHRLPSSVLRPASVNLTSSVPRPPVPSGNTGIVPPQIGIKIPNVLPLSLPSAPVPIALPTSGSIPGILPQPKIGIPKPSALSLALPSSPVPPPFLAPNGNPGILPPRIGSPPQVPHLLSPPVPPQLAPLLPPAWPPQAIPPLQSSSASIPPTPLLPNNIWEALGASGQDQILDLYNNLPTAITAPPPIAVPAPPPFLGSVPSADIDNVASTLPLPLVNSLPPTSALDQQDTRGAVGGLMGMLDDATKEKLMQFVTESAPTADTSELAEKSIDVAALRKVPGNSAKSASESSPSLSSAEFLDTLDDSTKEKLKGLIKPLAAVFGKSANSGVQAASLTSIPSLMKGWNTFDDDEKNKILDWVTDGELPLTDMAAVQRSSTNLIPLKLPLSLVNSVLGGVINKLQSMPMASSPPTLLPTGTLNPKSPVDLASALEMAKEGWLALNTPLKEELSNALVPNSNATALTKRQIYDPDDTYKPAERPGDPGYVGEDDNNSEDKIRKFVKDFHYVGQSIVDLGMNNIMDILTVLNDPAIKVGDKNNLKGYDDRIKDFAVQYHDFIQIFDSLSSYNQMEILKMMFEGSTGTNTYDKRQGSDFDPSNPRELRAFIDEFHDIADTVTGLDAYSLYQLFALMSDDNLNIPMPWQLRGYEGEIKDYLIKFYYFNHWLQYLSDYNRQLILAKLFEGLVVSTPAVPTPTSTTGSVTETAIETGTDILTETGTDIPISTGTDIPIETGTDIPIVTGTDIPIETGTDIPIVTGTDIPIETGTDIPITTGTDVPISTGTDVPISTGTDVPISTGTDVPISTGTDIPISTGTDVPISTGTDIPISTGTDIPIGTTTESTSTLTVKRVKRGQTFWRDPARAHSATSLPTPAWNPQLTHSLRHGSDDPLNSDLAGYRNKVDKKRGSKVSNFVESPEDQPSEHKYLSRFRVRARQVEEPVTDDTLSNVEAESDDQTPESLSDILGSAGTLDPLGMLGVQSKEPGVDIPFADDIGNHTQPDSDDEFSGELDVDSVDDPSPEIEGLPPLDPMGQLGPQVSGTDDDDVDSMTGELPSEIPVFKPKSRPTKLPKFKNHIGTLPHHRYNAEATNFRASSKAATSGNPYLTTGFNFDPMSGEFMGDYNDINDFAKEYYPTGALAHGDENARKSKSKLESIVKPSGNKFVDGVKLTPAQMNEMWGSGKKNGGMKT